LYALGGADQAKRRTKARAQRSIGAVPERRTSKKIFDGDPSTGNAPVIHSFSTRGLVYI
jgi:hypothetical protein